MSTTILPEKRSPEATTEAVKRSRITESPEDSHPIDCFAQGKVIPDDNNVSKEEYSDSDDELYLDPPGPIPYAFVKDMQVIRRHVIRRHMPEERKDIPEERRDIIEKRKDFPADWVSFCHICEEMTGHYTHVCPYRCVAFYKNDQCLKKVHDDDNHLYRSLAEPSGVSFF